MKTLALLFLLASAVVAAAPDLNKPIPELKLNNGRVLKNVEIVSYAATAVMAKWEGGRGTLKYEDFPDEYQAALSSGRPAPEVKRAPPPPEPARTISGQVFITTRGAGAYKFSGEKIYFYPIEDFKKASDQQRQIFANRNNPGLSRLLQQVEFSTAWLVAIKKLKASAHTTTDADGRYQVTLPSGSYWAFCTAQRAVGSSYEANVWATPVVGLSFDLNSNNQSAP